jgi:probable rRNA maturation factor
MPALTPSLASTRSSGANARIDIAREGRQWSDRRLDGVIRRAADAALRAAEAASSGPVEISVLLTGDAGIRGLNKAWRGIDKATNVLSFPAPTSLAATAPRQLGDLVLAHETIRMEARNEGKEFADHLAHLVVHGVLHLLGLDHMTDAEAAAMEACEIAALALLGVGDPYAGRAGAAPTRAKA